MTKETVHEQVRETFGDPRKAASWLRTPNSFFDGIPPAEFIDVASPENLQRVADELCRIDQGVF